MNRKFDDFMSKEVKIKLAKLGNKNTIKAEINLLTFLVNTSVKESLLPFDTTLKASIIKLIITIIGNTVVKILKAIFNIWNTLNTPLVSQKFNTSNKYI